MQFKNYLKWITLFTLFLNACSNSQDADLVLTNGKVYTYTWDDPATDGTPAANAPFENGIWQPDAQAIAVKAGKILFVGDNRAVESFRGVDTRIIDLQGAIVLPGLVDSHTHVEGIGANLERVDLTDIQTEEDAVDRIAQRAANVPEGQWIIGYGWDEGAWAGKYPDMQLLSKEVPNHPVLMRSLHSYAAWGNRLAFQKARITSETQPPEGGEIVKDREGNPTGILLNRATSLLTNAIPAPDLERRKSRVLAGLQEMARSGYAAIHEAGVDSELMAALEALYLKDQLPVRVYVMLSARDKDLFLQWSQRGLSIPEDKMLITRSVKAFYDGALGSKGARLLDDYSDTPGHRGVSGENYGFDQELVTKMIKAGFQVGVHAIGDAGNRETLDFFEGLLPENPRIPAMRHRIEHAQVVHPDDFERFAKLGIIASMQPAHAVEDKTWAEDRLGPERIKGAYAWRTLRKAGARLIFNSDLTGSDHNIFYGLHSAITRRSKDLMPPDGWYIDEAVTPEEAVRAYTVWPAYAAFLEEETGTLEVGKLADISVISLDPHNLDISSAKDLFKGEVLYTIVNGRIAYEKKIISNK